MKTIAYFISSHGYGHGVRSCQVIKCLSSKFRVIVFTGLPEKFLREELGPDFIHIPMELDCGCVQKDAIRVNVNATLEKYQQMNFSRDKLIDGVVKELKKCEADMVLADIPAMAFQAAYQAGIPGYGISNFNWVDIYEPYLKQHPEFASMVVQMKEDYALCTKYFSLNPGLDGAGFINAENIGMIGRKGRNKKVSIAQKFDIDVNKKWCLVYVGNFGLDGVRWDHLSRFRDWEFFGLSPLQDAADNYHYIQNLNFNYADLTASSDLVLGKLGYGLLTESLCNGVPVIFIERRDFAEYPVLKEELLIRGQGIEIGMEKLKEINIGTEIEELTKRKFEKVQSHGERKILAFLGASVV